MAQELYCMADNKIWTPQLDDQEKPLYLKIVDAMARDIGSGKLAIGERLPPQRQLAWHLGINHSTVTKAFQQAAKQHLIAGEVGRGTYVLGQSVEAELFLLQRQQGSGIIDLSTHVPVKKSRDEDLEKTLANLAQNQPGLGEYLDYHSPASLLRLNIHAANWLKQLGFNTTADQCVVTNTAQNALLVTLLASCSPQDVILVNEFTFPGMKALAKQMGLKLYPVKSDEQGIIPASLDLAIRTTGAKVLVSDPNFQNPTGATMGEQRVQQFVDIVRHNNLLFVEEYVVGCLSGKPPVSAQIAENNLIISSFAKAVAPGVRFAVIAGTHPVINQIQQESHATSWQLSPLMAEVAMNWIATGIAETRRHWQMKQISQRFRMFKSQFPQYDYIANPGMCSHVWLKVKGDAQEVASNLEQSGVRVVPSGFFSVGHHKDNYIRVSLTAAKTLQDLKVALKIIHDSELIVTPNV